MTVGDRRTCKVCGTQVSASREICPVCMLRSAITEGERRFENYELILQSDGGPIELGRGAMGVTYKALDVDLRCPVTLKVIGEKYVGDEAAQLRFLREARAAASVRHPNVASVLHLGRTGSSCRGGNA